MRRHSLVALLLVAASLGAMFADAARPPPEEPSLLKESECYACHSTGGGSLGPALPLLFLIHGPEEVVVPVGEKARFEVAVENAWVSELRNIVAIADLTELPYLGFTSDKEPILDEVTGVIAAATNTDDRVVTQTFTVPPGTSDLVISLQPDPNGGNSVPADLELRIWRPSQDPTRSAPHAVVNSQDGSNPQATELETFEVHGAKEIAELGVGEWTAGLVVPGPSTTNPNPGALSDQPFLFTVLAEFRSTGEARQFTGTSDVLVSRVEAPGQQAYLEWILTAESKPTEPATLPVEVVLTAYYAHGSTQISQYDEWHFVKTIDLQVTPHPSEDAVVIRANSVAELPDVKDGFAWDILSEIIGYLSAVLILASIYTGGMFGKATRRQLNAVFGTAKRRVAFHNALSYAILVAALIHTIIFLFEAAFDWTLGIIWGGIAILAMIGLGVTGALQVPMIRRWNYSVWRWSHFYLSIGTIVFTIVHILLDGVHFVELQETLGWSNPFTRA